MKYVIEVTSKVTLEIEADEEGKAVAEACETAWQHDPDEQNARVVDRVYTAIEAIAGFEKAEKEDADRKRDRKRRKFERAFRGGSGFVEEVD